MLALCMLFAQAVAAEIEPPAAEPLVEAPVAEAVEAVPATESSDVAETPEAAVSPEASESPDTTETPDAAVSPRSVKITSERTDYDRKQGVIMFDKDVFVEDVEYQMHADQLYVFLDGTNDLKRIVAIGNVAITNDLRVGTCAKATYTKATSKIVMYGDGAETLAKLSDNGKRKSEVEGRKITFWIDSEQVEVEGSTITLDTGTLGGKEEAKKLLGK